VRLAGEFYIPSGWFCSKFSSEILNAPNEIRTGGRSRLRSLSFVIEKHVNTLSLTYFQLGNDCCA